jgi:hypothetical protein
MPQNRRNDVFAHDRRWAVVACLASALLTWIAAPVIAQGGGGGAGASRAGGRGGDTTVARGGAGRQGRGGAGGRGCSQYGGGPLGCVPFTATDSGIKAIVDRLDFDSYKNLIKGLTQFGERRQGTPQNATAIDWIEAQLKGWGYSTERVKYEYQGSPREEVFATKIGATVPQEMYIIGGHMDGIGGGEAANDDASGSALVMEIARVLATADVRSTRSIRFALWNNEESGLDGAKAYVAQRASLQGIENPAGSGTFPEPKWLGMIQHDMMMWDHGNPVQPEQVLDADVDIEFQLNSAKATESTALAVLLLNSNRMFATDYPAAMSNSMSNTDSDPFKDLVPTVSLRENRRLYETGRGANPTWHRATDLFATFSDKDFRLGFNAAQTTLSAVARLIEARIAPR